MKYVDGFLLVVSKKNFSKYRKIAADAAKVWKKHGALSYFECVGDDLNPNTHGMKQLGFARLTKLKKGEQAWFSFIIYRNKKHRDFVNKKIQAYFTEEMKKNPDSMKDMPWDMKRFSWGGFKAVVEK